MKLSFLPRRWLIPYVLASLLLILFLVFEFTLPDGRLHLYFLNIGQGDATLIQTPRGKYILVDGGPGDGILQVLPEKLGFFRSRIDMVVLTHPHADHVEGLISVMERYEIPMVLYSGVESDTKAYARFKQLAAKSRILIARAGRDIEIEPGLYLDILAPVRSLENRKVRDDMINDTSVVFRLLYGDTHVLFTGDMEEPLEQALLYQGYDIQSLILKAGHHGSKTSSSNLLLYNANPKFATISVGKNNKFKHPNTEILDRFEEHDIQSYRTDQFGTIEAVCDDQTHCSFSWDNRI